MKKLLIILLLIIVSCASKNVFYYNLTTNPLEKLDSLGIANKLEIIDTCYWEKVYYKIDNGIYTTYFNTLISNNSRFIISIGKIDSDTIWEIRFREEKK